MTSQLNLVIMVCFLYILKSEAYNWYYVGFTSKLKERVKTHNTGGVKSTKSRKPFKLIYSEEYLTKAEARKRELELKRNWKLKKSIIDNILALSSNG